MLTSDVFEGRYVSEDSETVTIDGTPYIYFVDAVVEIWRTVYGGDSTTPEAEDREVGDWWIKDLVIMPESGDSTPIRLVSDSKPEHGMGFNHHDVFERIAETPKFQQWMNEVDHDE